LTISGSATTTSNVGINLSNGCFAISGTCLTSSSGTVNSGVFGQMAFYGADGTAVSGTSSIVVGTTSANANNIGIGTTSPYAKLSINPIAGDGPSFVIGSSTATKFIVDNAGNVGVGTTSPGAKLDITGDLRVSDGIAAGNGITIGTASGTYGNRIFTSGNSFIGIGYANLFYVFNSSGIAQFAVGATGATVTNNLTVSGTGNSTFVGNVGIGTTSPYAKLSVQATAGGQTQLFAVASSTNGAATSTALYVAANGNVGIGGSNPSYLFDVIRPDGTSVFSVDESVATVRVGISHGYGSVIFGSNNSSIYGSTDLLQFDQAGSGPISFRTTSGYLERMRIDNNGNVGIGTTSPYAKLSVVGDVVAARYIATTTATSTFAGGFSTNLLSVTSTTASSTFANGINLTGGCFAVSGACILSGSPSQWTTTGNDIYYTTGNVGIATTSPYAKLSVAGLGVFQNIFATSTTATSTFAGGLDVGNGALRYDFSSGITSISNLQLGPSTFESDSGIVSWIDMGVTAASAAGVVNSYTAQLNGNPMLTIYGVSDGAGGLSSRGVGIGTTSPYSALSVVGQVVADSFNATSSAGYKIGGTAFLTGSSTLSTTVLGFSALQSNTTGTSNIAIGSAALLFNTTGNYNIAIGDESQVAGFGAGTGSANVSLGYQTLASTFDISSTTAIGYQAGKNISTGVGNIMLGYRAGDNVTSGSNNILIGYDINGITNSLSNTLNIGNLIFGTGIDGTGNTVSSGKIGIGSTTPFATLSVSTTTSGSPQLPLFAVASSSRATLFNVLGNGNVGIGRSDPAYSLDVLSATGFDSTPVARFRTTAISSWLDVLVDSGTFGGAVTLQAGDGTRNLLLNGNKIGIGTSSPYAKLSVVGEVVARNYTATSSNATSTIAGQLDLASTTASGAGIISINGNRYMSNYGTNNIFMGLLAGNTTLTTANAHSNIGIGPNALDSLTDGDSNIAIGNNALTAVGTGLLNIAIGPEAGLTINGGARNAIMGRQALSSITTGSDNVAIGNRAGRLLTTTSSQNTILGSEAMAAGTGAANGNTVIGFSAGNAMTSGSNNILFGYRAGDNLTTGSSNIFIGYDIDATSTNATGTLNIGNLLFGTGLDGRGSTLSSGNIGVGTTSPAAKLTVTGAICASQGAGSASAACSTTAGTITASVFNTANADLAERYKVSDLTLEAGEVVSLDETATFTVKRATLGSSVIGIISTEPGFLIGSTNLDDAVTRPVALAGRVPVKFSDENGGVKIGDNLTVSKTKPGFAMKAGSTTTAIIGTALENKTEVGTVTVFVRSSFAQGIDLGDIAAEAVKDGPSLLEEFKALLAGTTQWSVARVSATTGFFKNIFADKGTFNKVQTSELCIEDVCVNKDQFKALINNAGVVTTSPTVIISQPAPATTTPPVVEPTAPVVPIAEPVTITPPAEEPTPVITEPASEPATELVTAPAPTE
jgi:hypothetical protein